jgi:hypothetical protein
MGLNARLLKLGFAMAQFTLPFQHSLGENGENHKSQRKDRRSSA